MVPARFCPIDEIKFRHFDWRTKKRYQGWAPKEIRIGGCSNWDSKPHSSLLPAVQVQSKTTDACVCHTQRSELWLYSHFIGICWVEASTWDMHEIGAPEKEWPALQWWTIPPDNHWKYQRDPKKRRLALRGVWNNNHRVLSEFKVTQPLQAIGEHGYSSSSLSIMMMMIFIGWGLIKILSSLVNPCNDRKIIK